MSEKRYKSRNRNITLEQHIGNRVFLFRHGRELSLEQLASVVGISYQQLTKYEKGENRIAASTLYQIAQYFGVSVDFFYQGYNGNKSSQIDTTIEGVKVMSALDKIRDEKSRKKILSHIIPIIKAFEVYFVGHILNKQCKKMLEERD